MFKLTGTLCIQTEVRLQRERKLNAFRNIYKRTAGPYSTMKSRKFVVTRSNQSHKILLYHRSPLFALYGTLKIQIYNALLCNFILNIVIDKFTVILSTNARKAFAFSFRNTQFFKCIFNVFRNVFPLTAHLSLRAHISRNVFHMKTFNIRHPVCRNLHTVIYFKRFKPEFTHPFRITLFFAQFADNFRRQSGFNTIKILFRFFITEIIKFPVYIINNNLIFCHNKSTNSSMRQIHFH